MQFGNGILEGSHSRQDDAACLPEDRWVARHHGRIAHPLKALLHAAEIAHSVVNDGDHRTANPRRKKQRGTLGRGGAMQAGSTTSKPLHVFHGGGGGGKRIACRRDLNGEITAVTDFVEFS